MLNYKLIKEKNEEVSLENVEFYYEIDYFQG